MDSIRLDNAGVMNIPCELTRDGYETQCQTVRTMKKGTHSRSKY